MEDEGRRNAPPKLIPEAGLVGEMCDGEMCRTVVGDGGLLLEPEGPATPEWFSGMAGRTEAAMRVAGISRGVASR